MKPDNNLRRRSPMSLKTRKAWTGILFISPWLIGFLGFFLRPLANSFMYMFNSTTIRPNSLELKFIGLDNFYRAFFTDTKFVPYLTAQIGSVITTVPIILAFSLLMAVIINGKFRGRTIVRAIFFLPVICGSGLILSIMQGDAMSNSILEGTRSSMLFQTSGLQDILMNMGVSQDLVNTLMGIVSNIFVLTWKSGLQILLFMAGLQTVSPSLYECAKIEGATGWETFWKVTFPMIGPMLVLNLVYTVIDNFTDYGNQVMQYIYNYGKALDFSYSAALSWIYFILVLSVLGIVYAFVNSRIAYTVD